jgi:IrrE N-terminal-like domain
MTKPEPATVRVEVKPELLRWARARSGLDFDTLAHRFPRLADWESENARPTQRPVEHVPIPDFRTVGNRRIEHPSPDLLDAIYICQQRQEWYRDFARSQGEEPLPFIGAASLTSDIDATAANMRSALGFDLEERRQIPAWTDAVRRFIEQADALGVLVMENSVVGNNNYRKLDPEEFRGFALSDGLAPLVFINGADTKAAQMFSLAHELAHLWLGQNALSDVGPVSRPTHKVERWCNRVAAEPSCRSPCCDKSISAAKTCAGR